MSSRRILAAAAAVIGLVAAGLVLAAPAQAATSAPVRPARVGAYVEIVNSHTNKCADVTGKSRSPGAVVHEWDCAAEAHQLWAYEGLGDGSVVRLRNMNSQLCMTALFPYTNGVEITQFDCDSVHTDDWWRVSPDINGFVKLIHVPSGKCLDLNRGSGSNGTKIQLLDCASDSNAQDWYTV